MKLQSPNLKQPFKTLSGRVWSYWRQKNLFEKWIFTSLAGSAVIWIVVFEMLLPAREVWRRAPHMQAKLDAQWSRVQQLEKKAYALREDASDKKTFPLEKIRELASSMLGPTTRVEVVEGDVHLEFEGVAARDLSDFLGQIYALRTVSVSHAQWKRGPIQDEASDAIWGGFMTLKSN
jgi:type II secretory pathway component PulM